MLETPVAILWNRVSGRLSLTRTGNAHDAPLVNLQTLAVASSMMKRGGEAGRRSTAPLFSDGTTPIQAGQYYLRVGWALRIHFGGRSVKRRGGFEPDPSPTTAQRVTDSSDHGVWNIIELKKKGAESSILGRGNRVSVVHSRFATALCIARRLGAHCDVVSNTPSDLPVADSDGQV